jgi:hypothetical protein
VEVSSSAWAEALFLVWRFKGGAGAGSWGGSAEPSPQLATRAEIAMLRRNAADGMYQQIDIDSIAGRLDSPGGFS